jgi:two-component system chemotaxis response regulator CheY
MKYILVVDDEQDILETIVNTLEIEFDEGEVSIHVAENGVEALKAIMNGDVAYDLVVTDVNMPEMGGIELTEKIISLGRGTPIIVFTGHGDIEEENKLHSLGVVAMVKKPFVEDLIEKVTDSLN